MKNLLNNKVIVISGGTKGIGKEIAIAAAKEGASVVIAGRDDLAGERIVSRIRSDNQEAMFVHIDLKNINDCELLFEKTISTYGKVDGFVNYAGVTSIASMIECDERTYDEIFDVNMKAAFFCTQNAIKHMKHGGGSIIIFGSPHDDKGEIDRAPYAFSKAALSVMITHIAKYYAPFKIRANYITMGWTPTEGELALRKQQGINEIELREIAKNFIPAGRMQEAEDYIPAVLYLLSDYSSMVTGSNIRITGGLYF